MLALGDAKHGPAINATKAAIVATSCALASEDHIKGLTRIPSTRTVGSAN